MELLPPRVRPVPSSDDVNMEDSFTISSSDYKKEESLIIFPIDKMKGSEDDELYSD